MKRLSILLSMITLFVMNQQESWASGQPLKVWCNTFKNPSKDPGFADTLIGKAIVLDNFTKNDIESKYCLPITGLADTFCRLFPVAKISEIVAFIPCSNDVNESSEFLLRTEDIEELDYMGVKRLTIVLKLKKKILDSKIDIKKMMAAMLAAEEFCTKSNQNTHAGEIFDLPDLEKLFITQITIVSPKGILCSAKVQDAITLAFTPIRNNREIEEVFSKELVRAREHAVKQTKKINKQ